MLCNLNFWNTVLRSEFTLERVFASKARRKEDKLKFEL